MHDDPFREQREAMLAQQLRARGIRDARVLEALLAVPRHEFVPEEYRALAYRDSPLPIGADQTISQPFIVAYMSQVLRLTGSERVLEIGTGSGYQTAIMCRLARHVFSLERIAHLGRSAAGTLHRLGYLNVDVHVGDGSQGLPDMAPFDAIMVTAAAPFVPGPLQSQHSPDGGRLIIPVGGSRGQFLELVERRGDRWHFKRVMAVKFVPLLGQFGFSRDEMV